MNENALTLNEAIELYKNGHQVYTYIQSRKTYLFLIKDKYILKNGETALYLTYKSKVKNSSFSTRLISIPLTKFRLYFENSFEYLAIPLKDKKSVKDPPLYPLAISPLAYSSGVIADSKKS